MNYPATVENGIWSIQVPVSDVLNLANTLYTVSVSGTDSVGNSGSAEANLLVDTVLPQVIINTFAGDNLVNNAEAGVDQTLSGRVTGAAAGDTVTITAGGKSYTATVGSDLTWSVKIPSADLQAFGDGDLTFSASVTNGHGNTGTGERDININAEMPGLRVNTISGDDVINAIEQQQDLSVTGSSTPVWRERQESGAMLLRLAPSHVRFGHFEYFYYTRQHEQLKQLADYVIAHHYPACREQPQPYAALLKAVPGLYARIETLPKGMETHSEVADLNQAEENDKNAL